eukprot:3128086-Rhodomonas_salina.3
MVAALGTESGGGAGRRAAKTTTASAVAQRQVRDQMRAPAAAVHFARGTKLIWPCRKKGVQGT